MADSSNTNTKMSSPSSQDPQQRAPVRIMGLLTAPNSSPSEEEEEDMPNRPERIIDTPERLALLVNIIWRLESEIMLLAAFASNDIAMFWDRLPKVQRQLELLRTYVASEKRDFTYVTADERVLKVVETYEELKIELKQEAKAVAAMTNNAFLTLKEVFWEEIRIVKAENYQLVTFLDEELAATKSRVVRQQGWIDWYQGQHDADQQEIAGLKRALATQAEELIDEHASEVSMLIRKQASEIAQIRSQSGQGTAKNEPQHGDIAISHDGDISYLQAQLHQKDLKIKHIMEHGIANGDRCIQHYGELADSLLAKNKDLTARFEGNHPLKSTDRRRHASEKKKFARIAKRNRMLVYEKARLIHAFEMTRIRDADHRVGGHLHDGMSRATTPAPPEGTMKMLEEENAMLREALAKKNEEIANLTLDDKNQEILRLQVDLGGQNNVIELYKEQITIICGANTEMESKVETLQTELEKKEKIISGATKKQRDWLKLIGSQKRESRELIQKLDVSIEKEKDLEDQLIRKDKALVRALDACSTYDRRRMKKTEEVNHLLEELEEVRESLTTKENELVNVRGQLTAKNNELVDVERQYESKKSEEQIKEQVPVKVFADASTQTEAEPEVTLDRDWNLSSESIITAEDNATGLELKRMQGNRNLRAAFFSLDDGATVTNEPRPSYEAPTHTQTETTSATGRNGTPPTDSNSDITTEVEDESSDLGTDSDPEKAACSNFMHCLTKKTTHVFQKLFGKQLKSNDPIEEWLSTLEQEENTVSHSPENNETESQSDPTSLWEAFENSGFLNSNDDEITKLPIEEELKVEKLTLNFQPGASLLDGFPFGKEGKGGEEMDMEASATSLWGKFPFGK